MSNQLETLTDGKHVILVVDNFWGDGGKGKLVDYLATYWSDVNVRGTGGNNAGHTTVVNGLERIFHLIPAGIVHDRDGKTSILGNGMVLDLRVLCQELDELDSAGMPYNNLMISEDAFVTLPLHVAWDKGTTASQKAGGVGSTGRGIGPAYADKIGSRAGVQVRDLFDNDILAKRFKKLAEYHSNRDIQEDAAMAYFAKYRDRIKPFVRDTIAEVDRFYKQGLNILGEGAQGFLLSSEFGTYPHRTASDCSKNGTATGMGIDAGHVDLCLGIVTFPIMHRVGGGPFPTELGGELSEKYCAASNEDGSPAHAVKDELSEYGIPFEEVEGKIKYDTHHPNIIKLMNSEDDMIRGIGLRLSSKNYGATTGRPRRMGYTDLMALGRAVMLNGPDLVLTKPNTIRGADNFRLCVGYEGRDHFSIGETYLRSAKPIYQTFKGSDVDITGMTSADDLPAGMREGMDVLESTTGGRIRMISVGAERNQNIII